MRFDQFMGLNKWAKKTVGKTITVREVGARIMPDKSVESFDRVVDLPLAQVTVTGGIKGVYTEEGTFVANLHRYTFPSGVVYEEYIQCTPWCGGPMYYIALRRPSGKFLKQSLWPSKVTQISGPANNSAND
jgi:hypothetical protein